MTTTVAEAVGERAAGGRPSRFRSILAALAVGAGASVLTYRLLRSGSSSDSG